MPQRPPLLLTMDEVAEILRVDEKTVRNIVKRGELRRTIIGERLVRFHPDDLEEYIDNFRFPDAMPNQGAGRKPERSTRKEARKGEEKHPWKEYLERGRQEK